jgi:hypothetical protein
MCKERAERKKIIGKAKTHWVVMQKEVEVGGARGGGEG